MHNYFYQIFLVFLFFCKPSSIYAMENNDNINTALANAVIRAENNKFTHQKDCQEIIKCIEQGANPNYENNGMTLLSIVVKYSNIDLVKCLIKHRANVNVADDAFPPLKHAIFMKNDRTQNYEITKELCNAGASLILNNETIFHYLTTFQEPKEYLEAIITHARFDTYDQVADNKLKETVLGVLLTFNKIGFSRNDLVPLILSRLTLDYFFGFNKKLCIWLALNKNCKNIFFPHIENRVKNITEILKIPDQKNNTPLQWWDYLHLTRKNNYQYDTQVKLLFNGTRLCNDMEEFKNLFLKNIAEIPENNLVLKMYNNALLHKQ